MTERVSLRDAEGLFSALRGPSIALRMGVLRAIAANPSVPLALGKHRGWDVIDELVHQAYQQCTMPYYRLLMKALAPYDDPRVDQLFFKVALNTGDAETRETVTARLHGKPAAVWLERLRPDAEMSSKEMDADAKAAASSDDSSRAVAMDAVPEIPPTSTSLAGDKSDLTDVRASSPQSGETPPEDSRSGDSAADRTP